jgi:hypothetical protein
MLDPDPDEMKADPQLCRREEQNDLPDDLKAGDAVLVVLGVGFQVLNVDVGQPCNTPLSFLSFNTFILILNSFISFPADKIASSSLHEKWLHCLIILFGRV